MPDLNESCLIIGNWAELGELALPLRLAVFVKEQGVPADLEHDEHDEIATHAVLQVAGQAVATGRFVMVKPDVAKVGRLAVAQSMRGKGFGRAVLQSLTERALSLGAKQIKLHAQCDAEKFYTGLGFVVQGEPFLEAGIDHVLMVRNV